MESEEAAVCGSDLETISVRSALQEGLLRSGKLSNCLQISSLFTSFSYQTFVLNFILKVKRLSADCSSCCVRVHRSGLQSHRPPVWKIPQSGAAALDVRGPGHLHQVHNCPDLSLSHAALNCPALY